MTDNLDLAILEFGYTSHDGRLRSAVESTVALAQIAEECGYSRFWITEHHASNLEIICPEVMIATIAAKTSRIRVGSAGILLGYYSPFKVAEVFHTLSTLFPNRIDLGLARGSGGSADVADLLLDGQPKPADLPAIGLLFERKATELIAHLRRGYETQQKVQAAAPLPDMPEIWLLGSGNGSAALAAKLGTKLAMALSYSMPETVDVRAVLATYAEQFQRAPDGPAATGCISLAGICAETDAEAKAMAAAAREQLGAEIVINFCGSPERCRETILELAERHGVRNVVIQPRTFEYEKQERMYRLLADVMLKDKAKRSYPYALAS